MDSLKELRMRYIAIHMLRRFREGVEAAIAPLLAHHGPEERLDESVLWRINRAYGDGLARRAKLKEAQLLPVNEAVHKAGTQGEIAYVRSIHGHTLRLGM